MDKVLAQQNTAKYSLGALLREGKTKQIYAVKGKPQLVLIVSKDDITAGDGAKHDLIPKKGALATETTCNVFRFLQTRGVATAFVEQDNFNSFVAKRCNMLPYEVVVRREAHGSYLKRNPNMEKGHRFAELLSELFLKTEGRHWKDHELVCDDPLMIIDSTEKTVHLYDPSKPFESTDAFLVLPYSEVSSRGEDEALLSAMAEDAKATFLHLEDAWDSQGRKLVDFKVEYGIDTEGNLLLADVIDNDSWRVIEDDGSYIDKQVYRDGGELVEVAAKYHRVAALTSRFLPE